MKKTIELQGIDPMLFAGVDDDNMKIIESNFNLNIVLRGNSLFIEGKKKEIEKIELLVNDIIFTNQEIKKDLLKKDIILHTHLGAVVAHTSGQKNYYKSVQKNDIVFVIGPAGTGKTFQAVASAVSALKNNEVEKIVITRPVVEAGERLGFLPGDLKDKVDPYLTPLYDALNKMVPPEKLKDAPLTTPVKRLNETKANRELNLKYPYEI